MKNTKVEIDKNDLEDMVSHYRRAEKSLANALQDADYFVAKLEELAGEMEEFRQAWAWLLEEDE